MKWYFILLSFILMYSFAEGQNKIDESGRKQGLWQKVDTAGQLVYVGQFKDDKPTGEFKYFFPDGKLRSLMKFSAAGNNAHNTTYYPNGIKLAEGNYVSKKKDSIWKYFDEKGILSSEENYKQGLPCGTWQNFYSDGKVQETFSFNSAGLKEGSWKQFYKSGGIKLSSSYQNGKLQGKSFYYYPDGSLLMQGTFNDDLKVGDWLSFNEQGKKASLRRYNSKGQLIKTEYFDKELEKEMTDMGKEIIEK